MRPLLFSIGFTGCAILILAGFSFSGIAGLGANWMEVRRSNRGAASPVLGPAKEMERDFGISMADLKASAVVGAFADSFISGIDALGEGELVGDGCRDMAAKYSDLEMSLQRGGRERCESCCRCRTKLQASSRYERGCCGVVWCLYVHGRYRNPALCRGL